MTVNALQPDSLQSSCNSWPSAEAGPAPNPLQLRLVVHVDSVRDFIRGRLRRPDIGWMDQEDVLQQTLIRAIRAGDLHDWRGEAPFASWLRTIAGNVIRDAIRRRQRERLTSGSAADSDSFCDPVASLIGQGETPSRIVRADERSAALRTAIGQLPSVYRKAVELFYVDRVTQKEIASELGRSPDAVRGILQRAREQLREQLGSASSFCST